MYLSSIRGSSRTAEELAVRAGGHSDMPPGQSNRRGLWQATATSDIAHPRALVQLPTAAASRTMLSPHRGPHSPQGGQNGCRCVSCCDWNCVSNTGRLANGKGTRSHSLYGFFYRDIVLPGSSTAPVRCVSCRGGIP